MTTFTRQSFERAALVSACIIVAAPVPDAAGQQPPLAPSCPANAAWAGPPRRQVPAEVWQRDFTRPIDGSLPAAVVSALQEVADQLTKRAPAVSVAVAIPGVGRWAVSQGVARSDRGTPLPPDARFQVASTTKTFTAVALLQLEAEGALRTGQSIEPWFDEAPSARLTTLDHLLRHTSGLVSFNALPAWTLDYRPPREAIAMALAARPQFCPGAGFGYSNTGYAMLGVVIENLAKRPLGEVFAERFARPIGLAHSALRDRDDDLPVVSGHVGGQPVDMPDHYATPFAAGGLASTAEDLVTFWHALLGGRLIPPASVRTMFTDLAPMDQSGQMFYGRGVQLYDIPQGPGLMLGHSGGITGFTSVVAYLAADDMYVSVIFNEQQVPAEAGLWAVVRAVRAARQAGK
ncbi:MAG: serine hydrolase domain-containing protein [Gemmatimonadales bacterium]